MLSHPESFWASTGTASYHLVSSGSPIECWLRIRGVALRHGFNKPNMPAALLQPIATLSACLNSPAFWLQKRHAWKPTPIGCWHRQSSTSPTASQELRMGNRQQRSASIADAWPDLKTIVHGRADRAAHHCILKHLEASWLQKNLWYSSACHWKLVWLRPVHAITGIPLWKTKLADTLARGKQIRPPAYDYLMACGWIKIWLHPVTAIRSRYHNFKLQKKLPHGFQTEWKKGWSQDSEGSEAVCNLQPINQPADSYHETQSGLLSWSRLT